MKKVILRILFFLLILLGFTAFFSTRWYLNIYGDLGFGSVIYTLLSSLGGTEAGLIIDYLKAVAPKTMLCTALAMILLWLRIKHPLEVKFFKTGKKIRLFPIINRDWMAAVFSLVLSVLLLLQSANEIGLIKYIKEGKSESKLYSTEYVEPDETKIIFPAKKRNLIYIYLESMENTYLSKDLGGATNYNLIPNLYNLAKENTSFSNGQDLGGWSLVNNTNWTVAALVSQTAGIPLVVPFDGNGYTNKEFLPGATTLTDILHKNGYYQAFMVGSDASFGGRREFYTYHGIDKIYDYFTAQEDGIIPKDYFVWWGFEDSRLYNYAKQEITKISKQEQPFAFSMLTVDTHHIDGYVCEYCNKEYSHQYQNVVSCADRQVASFVDWCKKQDFYENTTIVIVGDHLSMNNQYFVDTCEQSYLRTVYNCFINSAVNTTATKNRQFAPLDMFPTTLAAMGCQIEGEKLALGTNLFSSVQTLSEKYGSAVLSNMMLDAHEYNLKFFKKMR